MRLETLAVSKLMERMVNNGASLEDEQLPLMKLRKNRVAYFNNECEWGWLRNAIKKEYSSASFALVVNGGGADYLNASGSSGVRPAFRLKK